MANFSNFTALHLANVLKTPGHASYKDRMFPDLDLVSDYTLVPFIALITSAADLKLLSGAGNTNGNPLLSGEVLVNSDTKYVRKTPVWSTIFTPSNSGGTTHPPGVVIPSGQKGYAFFYNAEEIIWSDPPLAAWGTITHYAYALWAEPQTEVTPPSNLFNGLRRILTWGALTTPKVVGIDDIFRFPAGALQINIY